jgi:pyruvate-formate lyase-activating enzyme
MNSIYFFICAEKEARDALEALVQKSAEGFEKRVIGCPAPAERDFSALVMDCARMMAQTPDDLKECRYAVILSAESLHLHPEVLRRAIERAGNQRLEHLETPLALAPFPMIRARAAILSNEAFAGFESGESSPALIYDLSREEKSLIYRNFLDDEPRPETIFIEMTNRCNFRCIMCPCHGEGSAREMAGMGSILMDEVLYEKIIDEVASYPWKVTVVPQMRGESTLHPRFIPFLRKAKEKALSISLNTNASLLDDEKAEAVLDCVDSLFISIDAIREESFAAIRKGGNYRQVMANVESLLKKRAARGTTRPVIYASFVLIEENRQDLQDFLDYWHERVEGVMVYQQRNIRGTCDGLYAGRGPDEREPCVNIANSCAILADGNMVPCCNDNLALGVMGSVKRETILSVFSSLPYKKFRTAHALGHFESLPLCAPCDIWQWSMNRIIEEERWTIHENPPSRLHIRKAVKR